MRIMARDRARGVRVIKTRGKNARDRVRERGRLRLAARLAAQWLHDYLCDR